MSSGDAGSTPTIGLALGGGSARGLAHVLMLEALDELGLTPVAMAGTSIGSIVGSAYAAGLSAKQIRVHFEELFDSRSAPFKRMRERWPGSLLELWNPLTPALVNGETFFQMMLPDGVPQTFEELKIPLAIVATDFYSQDEVVLRRGRLIPAIAASSALPSLITPVEIDGRILIDGGYVNPTPFDLVRGKADITIGVDVTGATQPRSDGKGGTKLPGSLETWIGATQITFHSIVREKLRIEAPDIMIRPNVGGYTTLDFYKFREIFAASEPAKDELKRALEVKMAARGPA